MPTPTEPTTEPAPQAMVEAVNPAALRHRTNVHGLTPGVSQGEVHGIGAQANSLKNHLTGGGSGGQEDA